MVTSNPLYCNPEKLLSELPDFHSSVSCNIDAYKHLNRDVNGLHVTDSKITPLSILKSADSDPKMYTHSSTTSKWVMNLSLRCCVHVNTLIIPTATSHSVSCSDLRPFIGCVTAEIFFKEQQSMYSLSI